MVTRFCCLKFRCWKLDGMINLLVSVWIKKATRVTTECFHNRLGTKQENKLENQLLHHIQYLSKLMDVCIGKSNSSLLEKNCGSVFCASWRKLLSSGLMLCHFEFNVVVTKRQNMFYHQWYKFKCRNTFFPYSLSSKNGTHYCKLIIIYGSFLCP